MALLSSTSSKSTTLMDAQIIANYKTLGPPTLFFGEETIALRHGESIGEIFHDWAALAKMDDNFYFPFDLNVPVQIFRRPDMVKANTADPPLSELGKVSAQLIARELRERHAVPSAVYCSPDLASVETAAAIQKFLGKSCGPIRVEPQLSTNHGAAHHFFDTAFLIEQGFPIDAKYQPLKALGGPLSMAHIAANVKRAFVSVTVANKIVLVVTDALAMQIISTVIDGTNASLSGKPEDLRERATAMFPPLSSLVAFKDTSPGRVAFEESDVVLRPLTSIGASTDILTEDDVKALLPPTKPKKP